MKCKRDKIIMVIILSFLLLNLIWALIFWLPLVSKDIGKLIWNNPMLSTLWLTHNNFFVQVACFLISFANLFYAIAALRSMYKLKTSTSKHIISYLIYAIISLCAIVIHCITFYRIFMWVIAGWKYNIIYCVVVTLFLNKK